MSESRSEEPRNAKADAKAAKAYAKASRPWYKKKRWIAVAVVAVIAIAGAAGAGGDEAVDTATSSAETSSGASTAESPESAEDTSNSTDAASEPEPEPEPVAPDMAVSAKQILDDFDGNEASADAKYDGQTLEITGVVAEIDTELLNEDEYVVQLGGGGDFEFLTVNCDDQTRDAVTALSPGDELTVVADFEDGGDLGVELDNCVIQS